MRKLLIMMCAVLALAGCAKKAEDPAASEETAAAEPTAEPAAEATEEPEEDRTAPLGDLKAYQAQMELYEDLEIAFLGTVSMDRSLDEVLSRAASMEGLSLVSKIDDSRIIYGDRGEYTDYVYLVIPALNTDLKIGRYNFYAGEITDLWVDEIEAQPLIYVESGDSIDPLGRIEYVRHFADGDTDGFLYTGLTAVPGELRTAYHMGVVDLSVYEAFDSTEIPFYSQMFFDRLQEYDEIRGLLDSGARISTMEEMMWDGHAYMVYAADSSDDLYAVSYDPLSQEMSVIVSRDLGMTWEALAFG